MRYLVGFVLSLAVVASPLSASAQAGEEGSSGSWQIQYAPSPSQTELKEAKLRVKRARVGVGVSTVPIVIGGIIALRSEFINAWSWEYPTPEEEAQRKRLLRSGIAVMGVGAASMIATGILLGVRKRKLRRFQEVADLGHRRVQWDLARSRLVF